MLLILKNKQKKRIIILCYITQYNMTRRIIFDNQNNFMYYLVKQQYFNCNDVIFIYNYIIIYKVKLLNTK